MADLNEQKFISVSVSVSFNRNQQKQINRFLRRQKQTITQSNKQTNKKKKCKGMKEQ